MKISFAFSILILIINCICPIQSVQAQSPEEKAVEQLRSEGFEEIRVLKEGNSVICSIEQGLYRTPSEDFRRALFQLNSLYPDTCQFLIVLLEQGQPLYQLTVKQTGGKMIKAEEKNPDQSSDQTQVGYYDEKNWRTIKKVPASRRVNTGVTLTIYPQIAIRNIHLDQLYEKQFNLAPVLQYSAWKGMLLTGQLIFPLYNEYGSTDDYIRPGFITFRQNISLPAWNSLIFSAGNFNKNSYGLDLRWEKRFQHSRWNLGANMGLTGTSYFYDRYWLHSDLYRFSWNLKAGYYLPSIQLQADLQAGQFLANDMGVRADLYRHFGEVTIGAYAGYAGGRVYGGFHFAIPLDPFRRRHNNRFRILLPATIDNEYNATDELVYGRYYETRPDENRSVQDIPVQFINRMFNHP